VNILLDCDGVLADFPSAALRYINARAGREYLLGDIEEHDILKALSLDHWQADFDRWCIETDVCRELEPYKGARAFVDELRTLGDVICVTSPYSAVPNWMHSRLAWLSEHVGIGKRDVVFCKRKELVRGHVLIDDKLENCEDFVKGSQHRVAHVFDRPWNRQRAKSGGHMMMRARGYGEVLAALRAEA
jgi:5'(3')-deoxyribonucleotidase